MRNITQKIVILWIMLFGTSMVFAQSELSPGLVEKNAMQKKEAIQQAVLQNQDRPASQSLTQQEAISGEKEFANLYDKSPNAKYTSPSYTDDLFDLQFDWPVGVGGGEAGIETDGSYIYTTKWNGADFYKYELDGTYIESFTCGTASNVRDLAYDGTYFYGGAGSPTVFQMDFGSQTVISTFTAPTDVRAIAYNETDSYFYANNWSSDIVVFDMSGTQVSSFAVGASGASYYGFAYDGYSSGAPFLWGYSQTGATQNDLIQMQLPDGTETGLTFDVGSVAAVGAGLAGGLAIADGLVPGYYTILGTSQNVDIWGLELTQSGPLPAADVGIMAIVAPSTGVNLSNAETVTVTIKNYGTDPQSNFDVSYTLDGGMAVTETITETINGGETLDHTFATTEDLSAYGSYEFQACTALTGDENPNNDCKAKTVENLEPSLCAPTYSSGCSVGDGFTDFAVEEIQNLNNGCANLNGTGWSQYFGLGPAILIPGNVHVFQMATGYGNQYVNIWIDFNDDLDLTADEMILQDYVMTEAGVLYDVDITIPANATPGEHVMRAMTVWASAFTDPCGSYSYGEAEDYKVIIGVAEYGNLTGVVTENTGGAPIEGAVVAVKNGMYTATTLSDGTYTINDILVGDWDITCTKDGYNPISGGTVSITNGNTTTMDFAMTAPTMDITPTEITVTLEEGQTSTELIDIANNGDGTLDWNATLEILNSDNSDDMFDLIWDMPVGVGGGEAGIETDGNYIYTTKWNGTEFYKYDMSGNYIETFSCGSASNVRDLAFDGTYFYGAAASPAMFQMDFTTQTVVSTITAPTDVRAIAYNENDNVFYANNWSSDIVAFDMSGTQVGSFPIGASGASYYGFAYDGYSAGAPYLWGYSQTGATQNDLIQMQLPDGTETGLTFDVGSVTAVGTGIAGGLAIDDHIAPGFWAFLGTAQNVNLWALELTAGGGGNNWITIDPTSGTVDVGNSDQMNVNLDATGLTLGMIYNANINFTSDPDVGSQTVPVTLIVGSMQVGHIQGNVFLDGVAPYNIGDVTEVVIETGPYTTNPDANGDYDLTVYPGTYDVTATLYGYDTQTVAGVVVDEGATVSGIDFTMPCLYGIITGTVTNEETGNPIENVNIVVEGTDFGAVTAADGTYTITIEAGTYTVIADHLEYAMVTITDVVVDAQATTTLDIEMMQDLYIVMPQSADYWTGTTNGTDKTEVSYVKAWGGTGGNDQGWMKFDVTSIPTGAVITSVTFHGYVTNTNFPYWSITPMDIDPVTASGADIWNTAQAGSGQDVAYSYNNESSTFAPGWHEYLLSETANEDLTNALSQGWFAVGIYERDGSDTYYLEFDGWAEPNVPYLEVEFFVPEFGVLSGTVTELATGNPIEGATVTAVGPWQTYTMETLADGTYSFDPCQVGTYDMTCTADGYNPMAATVDVTVGNTTVQDFAMTAPDFNVDPMSLDVTLDPNAMTDETLTVNNPGNGDVNWTASVVVLDNAPSDDMFDLLFDWPVGVGGGEAGIETDGQYIYTTKWNGADFYKYGMDGTYIETFTCGSASNVRDLAYDGTYFYGAAASTTLFQMDFNTQTVVSTITAATDVRAIAYNENENVFYANNWSSDITVFDMTGAFVNSFPVGASGASYYGFAYDGFTDGGPYLWGYSQTGNTQNDLIQMQLPDGTETGLTFDVGSVAAVGTGIAGGLSITETIVPGLNVFLGTSQNVDIWVLELGPAEPQWLTLDPTSGSLTGGGSETVTAHFDATGLLPAIYQAEIHFSTNPDVGSPIVPVTLTVEGLIPAINLALTYNCTDVELTWEMPTGGDPDSWKVYRDGEEIADVTEMSYTDALVDPEVEYSYYVTAVYAGEESMPTPTETITVPTPGDLPPLDFEGTVDTGVVLTWSVPAACVAPDGYNIYRDGVKINDVLVTELTYFDDNTTPGFYEYYATAVYYFGESGPSEAGYVQITGIDENIVYNMSIYPNPASNIVYVETDLNIESLEILNNAGQVILTQKVDANTSNFDVSTFERGIYFIKMITEKGTVIRKIAVK